MLHGNLQQLVAFLLGQYAVWLGYRGALVADVGVVVVVTVVESDSDGMCPVGAAAYTAAARYTYATLAEARREYAGVTTEASAGTLVRRDKVTVGAFLTEWLDTRRVRPNTLDGYRAALKPVIGHLGTVPLQHLDELVTLRLTGEPIDAGLVAVNPDGSPIRPETYSKAFRRHCAAAGVPVIRLHDTRHTAATRMLDSGATVFAAAKWLGDDPAMTLRVYGHVYDDALASAGDALFGVMAHSWHNGGSPAQAYVIA